MTQQNETLDQAGLRLLKLLESIIPRVKPGDPRTYITYKQVHDQLNLDQQGPTFGESLQVQGLDSLALWTEATLKPAVTGLIVNQTTLMPGGGYFKIFKRTSEDFVWWRNEVEKSTTFDWQPYLKTELSESDEVSNSLWNEEELRATVEAYLAMQNLQRAGQRIVKASYYKDLAIQFGRRPGAYERRMQNISYVMSLMGRDWLLGLVPATHVGSGVAAQIEALICDVEGKPIAPVVEFEIEVRRGVNKKDLLEPRGSLVPQADMTTVTVYRRDPLVKAWVLRQAAGKCECCQAPAPFHGADGLPFLEVHHVIKLAERGADTISNAVAVCPNCHRELHYGDRSKELVEALYVNVERLQRELTPKE
ncbi:HNH endonuclease signature motif containing protein [Pseudomonas fulva]|uniref:HNH endonuclease n=1 Tax=Pseudomonas fulva TaxID=47880 RepID=UPI002E24F167